MAIPAYGTAGTEVLYRTSIHAQGPSHPTAFEWDRTSAATGDETYTVDTDHIITVLSITFCNMDTASTAERLIDLYIAEATNGNPIYLLNDQTLGPAATFIWNDKFSLVAGDILKVDANAGANIDCYCTYIDQVF